ncbi:hypothetical protein [Proteiniborus sp. MB09-C3]|nr:hypothetical protein [Proteiniborus sp. MB09-C3]WIV12761.1 hypothetical protein QO263_03335 [Proteiniborus sp. MB09-C3]
MDNGKIQTDKYVANSKLYLILHQNALEYNMCTYEDLLLDRLDYDG